MAGEESHKLGSSDPSGSHPSMSVFRKLMLTAVLTGNDVCISFQQLYMVPLLQVLGVPVTYVSLTPLLSGPLAMVLMNLTGFFSDKGRHHRRRKVAMVVINSFIILAGLAVLVWANLLMVNDHPCTETNHTVLYNNRPEGFRMDVHLMSGDSTAALNGSRPAAEGCTVTSPGDDGVDVLALPAVLGMAGIFLLDTGYDLNTAATRACILACSSGQDHTSLLLTALVMAAVGGCITTVMGSLDLSAVLGLEDRLMSQTTFQLAVCIIVVIVCIISTTVTALLNIERLHSHPCTSLESDQTADQTVYGTFHHENQVTLVEEHKDKHDAETWNAPSQETSLCAPKGSAMMASGHASISDAEDAEYVPKESSFIGCADVHQSKRKSGCSSNGDVTRGLAPYQKQCGGFNKHKFNFVIACIACYFGTSVLYPYNMYVADFLGKEVMGGDYSAPQGSAELQAYEDAARTAATGLLVFFCCYMGVSVVHNKLLGVWGVKVDFCLSHGLMAAAVLCLALTKQLAAFYVCCVLYGFQRSALFSVPYIIANDYVLHQQTQQGNGCGSSVGMTMAKLTCMIPLNYCTLFLISGPLITLTHENGAPLLLASVSAFLAAFIFLLNKS